MNKISWDQFGIISDTDQLLQYLDGRQYNHSYYFHYTGLSGIDGILNSKSFWISSFRAFNDKAEAKKLRNPELYFSLCFSTGLNENLPLWYMYSGLTGRGGRLRLTNRGIAKLLENATYELSEKDSSGKPVGHRTPLEPGRMIDITFGDVLYCGDGNNANLDMKYNTMTNHIFPISEKEKLYNRFEGFVKSLIWYYEKETRLLIRLTGEAEKLVDPEKDYMIILHFDESVYKMFTLTFGPEFRGIENDLNKYKHIKDFMINTSKVKKSAYAGEIEMNLCKRCNYAKNP